MDPIWKRLLANASDLLPDFNDFLLLEFRNNKINQIRNYLDALFRESVKLFPDGRLKYNGWQELTPDERLEYIRTNKILNKRIEVQKSSFELLRFNFEFEGIIHPVFLHVPYLEHGAVWLSDTRYFPLFPIVERGGLHRTAHDIIIKVMRAPITFKRNETFSFTTSKAKTFRETVLTVKIHQRKRGRGGKRTDRTPILLYHLTKHPFDQVMKMYGFDNGEISIVPTFDENDDKFSYIMIKEGIYLKVLDTAFGNINKRRVIASYLMILAEHTKFELRELVATHLNYYWCALGKFTSPAITNAMLMYDAAKKHLETTDPLLDPPAQYQLSQIGINVKDIYDLLLVVFFNIDNWLVGYNPTNLYEKKIGALDQIMAPLVTLINNRLFQIVNNKGEGLTQETVKKFVNSASQHESWLTGNSAFRANPSICNDNWMIAIGTNRFRSLENAETKGGTGGRNMPVALLKAHPSQLVVESLLCLPPSNPIVSGNINAFLQIDEDGNILVPEWASELDRVFD